ncbi:hypothetical protein [Roseomonas genomospecies 6]|uniref:Uncharacterized protein n=1 Tax=Roseomonas genomospecies 6 TaxID=214106 RepID=A0A9W7NJB3_9PROT|nr:hypothetical protein [Roseomonas genomospecies 6]KAA0680282.1 hypothetical protein DS843_13260 [Roseomonas genomospecies 6]
MAVSENTTLLPLAHLPRATLEAIVELALAEMDRRDGDPDREENGDAEWDVADVEHAAWAAGGEVRYVA